jgi:hypothetical protein
VSYPTKIATCCFCGSKAALTLDAGRHELSCAQCGAPLHNLKQIPISAPQQVKPSVSPELRRFAPAKPAKRSSKPKVKHIKRKKSWLKMLTNEVFDVVEDIFD